MKIQPALAHIEENLTDTLSIDALAASAFFSRTHYQRLFRAAMGESVMEYIKKRRLQQACNALAEGKSVMDTALTHGYESYEGFSRAFKAYFGMPPTRYKNLHAGPEKEETTMISTALKAEIKQHTQEVIRVYAPIGAGFARLAQEAEAAGKKAGSEGITTVMLAEEFSNLSRRIEALLREMEKDTAHSVFDITAHIYTLVRQMDDTAFQMNLLQFLSGVEIARVANPSPFENINQEVNTHIAQAMQARAAIMDILNAVHALVHEEIKRDAAAHYTQAHDLLQKTAADGTILAADTRAAALSMGEQGTAFAHIASEIEKITLPIKTAADTLRNFSSNDEVKTALNAVRTVIIFANFNAFNAKVETARSGDHAPYAACTARLFKYTNQLHETCQACFTLFEEGIKLMDLQSQRPSKEWTLQEKLQKSVEDIRIQTELLLSQTRLEAERCKIVAFRNIADEIENALTNLSDNKEAVANYNKMLAKIIPAYQTEIKNAGNHGIAHAVIANEFEHLNERITAVLGYA
ncbi:MAG: AraC family transcriptional regulator [Defluviitaleaceae bacterium]|nr:AraC family transcriptional regulator [Defluviitaleaceae bacterium]MCL2275021.1 AraC family transcriptional regulator [Defluviitaleaceae bacterium]